jgi:hypothetical protein
MRCRPSLALWWASTPPAGRVAELRIVRRDRAHCEQQDQTTDCRHLRIGAGRWRCFHSVVHQRSLVSRAALPVDQYGKNQVFHAGALQRRRRCGEHDGHGFVLHRTGPVGGCYSRLALSATGTGHQPKDCRLTPIKLARSIGKVIRGGKFPLRQRPPEWEPGLMFGFRSRTPSAESRRAASA